MILEKPSFSYIYKISRYLSTLISFLVFTHAIAYANEVTGQLKTWHRVSITFDGPSSDERAAINPFTDYRLQVVLTHEASGRKFSVPGFYAADGDAAESSAANGNKWRVYFTPHAAGKWTYTASFRTGNDIAISEQPGAGKPASFDGDAGSFEIEDAEVVEGDFRSRGMLQYVGGYHLQYAGSKAYYIKVGPNGPENLLAYSDFDGTYDTTCNKNDVDGSLHQYVPHIADWQPADPVWKEGKGKGLIGALNYLSSKGLNSLYFLTYNLDGGDGCDVWPWVDDEDKLRFDVSKLAQWEVVFNHMDKKGIQLHMVLSERQNAKDIGSPGENGGTLNNVRKLYYREMVARFGHHLALQWNLGEENTNNNARRKDFAAYIRSLDPYDHPITVHTSDSKAFSFYDDILGHSAFEATSLQADISDYNELAAYYRKESLATGRKWAVYADEQSPNAGNDRADQLRQLGLYGNLMGGGAGVEWYFSADLSLEDFRKYDLLWDEMAYASEFFQRHVPFSQMAPANELTPSSKDYVLAKPGQTYVIYVPEKQPVLLDLTGEEALYNVRWFNPRTGGALLLGDVSDVQSGGMASLGNPPGNDRGDWIALVSTEIVDEDQDDVVITPGVPLYRVNAGGSGIHTKDVGANLGWERDTKNKPSFFVNAGNGSNKTSKKPFRGENTTSAPSAVFDKQRWDPLSFPEMEWSFPVPTPGMYQVKLFFAEKSANKAKPNARVFDVVIEGNLVLDDYDIFADAGFQVATEKTFEVFVRDDVINILFVHEVGDPILSAIEIASSGDDEPPAIFETSVSNRRDDVLDFPAQFEVPTKVTLSGNYPNPFSTATAILLDLPKPATVHIDVFDMLGRKVDEKTAEQVMSGFQQEIPFSAKDLQPGAYLYRVYIQDGLSQTIQHGRFVIIR